MLGDDCFEAEVEALVKSARKQQKREDQSARLQKQRTPLQQRVSLQLWGGVTMAMSTRHQRAMLQPWGGINTRVASTKAFELARQVQLTTPQSVEYDSGLQDEAREVMREESNCLSVRCPVSTCGDLHDQCSDFK